MENIIVLLSEEEVKTHIRAITINSTKFDAGIGLLPFDKILTIPGPPSVSIFLKPTPKDAKPIGRVQILPGRTNSSLIFVAETPNADFDEFVSLVVRHFRDLYLIDESGPTKATKLESPTANFATLEYNFLGTPGDLRLIVDEIIDIRIRLDFNGMIGGQATPLEIIEAECSQNKTVIRLWRFQEPSVSGTVTAWGYSAVTRLNVVYSDSNWQSFPYPNADGWLILHTELVRRKLIQPITQDMQIDTVKLESPAPPAQIINNGTIITVQGNNDGTIVAGNGNNVNTDK